MTRHLPVRFFRRALTIFMGQLVQTVAIALSGVVQLVLFMRWLYRRIRNDELMRVFVSDMATNHLPHIYQALRTLCAQQGIRLEDAPPIRWLELNGKRH